MTDVSDPLSNDPFSDDPASLLADPSVAGPDILFSTGTVTNGTEDFQSVLPSVLGDPDTAWNLTQWNTPAAGIFDPATPVSPGAIVDPLLGASLASWQSSGEPNASSTFAMFGGANNVTYRLGASGGSSRDTFLQTTGYAPATLTFDQDLVFDVQERVAEATAGGGNAYAFNGFTVFFNQPGNPHYDPSLQSTEIFLQAPITDSRGEPAAYSTLTGGQSWQAIYDLSSENAAGNDGSVATLDYAADTGSLHDVRLDLSAAMARMTAAMAALDPAEAAELTDLSRWSLGSVYIGVESNGDGSADPAALSIDVADPTVFAAPGGDAGIGGAIQSIDAGAYAVTTASPTVTTAAGTVNTLQLSALMQEVFSYGQDQVIAVDGGYSTLHALGESLSVQGEATGSGSVTIDGAAPIHTFGSFHDLSVSSASDGALIDGSVSGRASLTLSGAGVDVSIDGTADAVLAGASASFAAAGGTVSLFAPDAAVDQDGTGTQTAFLNGYSAMVTQDAAGQQTIVGSPTAGGQFNVSGGTGTQWVWTGNANATVQAAATGTAGASMNLAVQANSSSSLALGGENGMVIDQGGDLSITGAPIAAGTAGAEITVFASAGTITMIGGAENTVAVLNGGNMSLTAGSGAQQVFGQNQGTGTLTVMGSHAAGDDQTAAGGSQTLVDAAATIFGGNTAQQIWTGNANDTVVSSALSGDAAGGSIALNVQGGTSAYWGGVENATLDNSGGVLDAFLRGGGAVSIGVDMAAVAGSTTVIQGFDPTLDTLTLRGLSSPVALTVDTDASGTTLSFGASHVLLADSAPLSGTPVAGAVVFGRG